jgi:hypothetical protein
MCQQWISVKHRLPEVGVGVLITDGHVVACGEYRGRNLYWSGHGFRGYEWEFDFDDDDITHWMPLPELPGE